MGIRERARELAVQALYQYALRGKEDLVSIQSFSWMESERAGAERIKEQAGEWFTATLADLEAIDALIEVHLDNWSSDRVGIIERAILRLAVYELRTDAEVAVVIDEAITLAKRYCDNDSFKFVNGVLDAIATTLSRKA